MKNGLLDWLDAARVDTVDVATVLLSDDQEIVVYHKAGPIVYIEVFDGRVIGCKITSRTQQRATVKSPDDLAKTLSQIARNAAKS